MNQKVLLVDDEPKVLASLSRCLGDRFSLTCAGSAAEALALVDSDGPFAAVVSDMRMPGMSGLELLRILRRRAPETVRLVLSGHADLETAIAAVNEGAVFRFHTKPVAPEVLTASLDCALLRHQQENLAQGRIDPAETLVRDVTDLRHALRDGQLRLMVQPQWRLADATVVGAEALVRWAHPERGLLLPGQFLSTVEAAGLMPDLTALMLDTACAEARRWHDLGLPPMRIAVNATALDLCDSGFVQRVRRTLERHDVSPRALELELTEGMAVTDPDGTRAVMAELAGFGVATSIDDFGSGYASLGWLRQLPVAKLKVDRMFIEDVAADPAAYRMLETIGALARDLHLTILAEGVETAAQMEMVRRAGCDQVQGFLVARPMPPDQFTRWLAAGQPWDSGHGG